MLAAQVNHDPLNLGGYGLSGLVISGPQRQVLGAGTARSSAGSTSGTSKS